MTSVKWPSSIWKAFWNPTRPRYFVDEQNFSISAIRPSLITLLLQEEIKEALEEICNLLPASLKTEVCSSIPYQHCFLSIPSRFPDTFHLAPPSYVLPTLVCLTHPLLAFLFAHLIHLTPPRASSFLAPVVAPAFFYTHSPYFPTILSHPPAFSHLSLCSSFHVSSFLSLQHVPFLSLSVCLSLSNLSKTPRNYSFFKIKFRNNLSKPDEGPLNCSKRCTNSS